jgi:hypothetical protein
VVGGLVAGGASTADVVVVTDVEVVAESVELVQAATQRAAARRQLVVDRVMSVQTLWRTLRFPGARVS